MVTEDLKRKAGVIKALAHPSRLAMVEALAQGERCVCELQEVVGSDISTVSRHLSVLKQAGIVSDRKQGLWVYYSLRTPCVTGFLGCIDAVMGEACECAHCLPARRTTGPAPHVCE
jgi:DNA-binding transcriptional ArsR family regulator